MRTRSSEPVLFFPVAGAYKRVDQVNSYVYGGESALVDRVDSASNVAVQTGCLG
jgi:hypothetical protein